ncbi:MAG TPA: MFS transporter, partial [Negativicutes bacterium]
ATEFSIYRVIAGVAMGGSFPNVIALASDYAPQPIRAFFIASPASTGMCIGGMASALIGIWLLPEYGWRSVFYVGVLPLVIVPFLMLHLPEAPINYIKRNRIAKLREILVRIRPDHTFPADATFEVTQQSLEKAPLIAVFQKNRAVSTIGIWAVYFMVTYMIYGLSFWMPKLMMNAGYPLKSALWFWFSVNAFGIVGIQLAGWFADRFSPKKVMYVVLLLAFVSITLLGVKSNFWIAILLAGLAGSSFQAAISVWNGYCANYYPPTMRSTGVGYAMCVARFGSILGPALSGLLMTMNVSAMSSFLGLSLPGLIGFFCLFLVNEKYSFTYGAKELANRPASNHNI